MFSSFTYIVDGCCWFDGLVVGVGVVVSGVWFEFLVVVGFCGWGVSQVLVFGSCLRWCCCWIVGFRLWVILVGLLLAYLGCFGGLAVRVV